jgi:hypothetical protein
LDCFNYGKSIEYRTVKAGISKASVMEQIEVINALLNSLKHWRAWLGNTNLATEYRGLQICAVRMAPDVGSQEGQYRNCLPRILAIDSIDEDYVHCELNIRSYSIALLP